MDATTFNKRCERISLLVNRRLMEAAHDLARKLVRDVRKVQEGPRNYARAYFLLHLIICTANKDGGPHQSQKLIDEASRCDDFTPTIHGDMLRDRVLGLIRAPYSDNLQIAERLFPRIRELHAGDLNRQACLTSVGGRLAYAYGERARAAQLHERAQNAWSSLGNVADQQWIYNNLLHWLKAVIATQGRKSPLAQQLVRRITTDCPKGAKRRSSEARIIQLPIIGNWMHDLVLRCR